jgi:hypothetical protein
MQDGTQTKRGRSEQPTENITMKFILSFLIATAILSADTCVKLSLGNAALSNQVLCAPVNIFTPPTPIKCVPVLSIPTIPTILCNLPTAPQCPPVVIAKCPAPIICPPPVTPPIPCPPVSPKCPTPPAPPTGPNCATPEPASFALLGIGLFTAGVARRFRKK